MPADPDPSLPLLWRHVTPPPAAPARRGPRQRVTLDAVVDAAIALADEEGLEAVTMRTLAARLGVGAMSLYTYVPGRSELVVLMVDQVAGEVPLPPHPDDLRARLLGIARQRYDECRRHPWLHDVTGVRHWLGPHVADRYEWQLRAVDGLGLDDLEMDQTVTLLAGYAGDVARREHEVRRAERATGTTELAWWEANAGLLGELMAGREYPLAGRVGTAAGEAYQASSDQGRELEFGLARIVDGLLVHLERRREPR